MVVDDSAVIRGLITRMLEGDSELTVTASVGNGQLAVNQLTRNPGEIDVVILDIEMPVMDGLTALPLLLKADPNVKVIMASIALSVTCVFFNSNDMRFLRLANVLIIGFKVETV